MPLKIAAKVDAADRAYFRETIEPLLDDPLIEFVGEIGDAEKSAFLGNARALLFPIDWPEPFGLVMIEAMACGTPVIAWRCGSVPEIIDDGVTGFIVDSEDEAVAAVERAGEPRSARGPRRVRAALLGATVMARNYLRLYRQLLHAGQPSERPRCAPAARGNVADLIADDAAEPADTGEPRVPLRLFALKHGDTFLVADAYGDILGDGDGLFHDDTRLLSRFRLTLGGTAAVAAGRARSARTTCSSPPTSPTGRCRRSAARSAPARGDPHRAHALAVGGAALRAPDAAPTTAEHEAVAAAAA